MNLLLDTHMFLWLIGQSNRVPPAIVQAVKLPTSNVYLSSVSVWECMIKYQSGKLPLPAPAETYLPAKRQQHLIETLPIDEATVLQLTKLPPLHQDPFDRLLVCQAMQHGLVLATVDRKIQAYPIATITG